MSDFTLPKRGIVFWPVGVGDSTTVVVDQETIFQVDLHHLGAAEDDDDPRTPIVDRLLKLLPKRDGKPYLAGFAATHLDEDHILGFAKLLDEKVTIGDLWFTPRIFRDVDEGTSRSALLGGHFSPHPSACWAAWIASASSSRMRSCRRLSLASHGR